LWGKSETVVKKSVIPLRPNAVDNTLRYQGPKNLERPRRQRDDVTPAASTSAFAGDCGGSSGGDNGCDGGHSGGGGGMWWWGRRRWMWGMLKFEVLFRYKIMIFLYLFFGH